jgi:adenine-specific DNA-methyltransferase
MTAPRPPATIQPIDKANPEAQSAKLVEGNLAQLKALFPEAFTEGRVDFEVLKQLLGAAVDEREEKYGLNWHGKRRARQLALTPSTGTLRPCPEESVDWDTTQNLFIEGDNLEVLKLLQKSYAGKVKLIYIDPPYNTGKDFVYPDNFQDSIKNYLELTGQIEGGERATSNTESSGRFHTRWLNMIYPRLQLAWGLLRRDGFVVVSIDDKELGHLRTVMNELFGEENFVASLVFDRNRKNDAKLFSVGHEYMVVYARDKALLTELDLRLRAPKEGVEEVRELFAELRKRFNDDWTKVAAGLKEYYDTFVEDDPRLPLARYTRVDERGPHRTDGDPSWPGGGGPRYEVRHPRTGGACKIPSRGWVWPTFERMKLEIDAGNIAFGEDETTVPMVRRDLFVKDEQVMRSVIFSYAQKATQDFTALFGGAAVFQNPKSYRDLQRLVSYLTEPGDLVLDFFAGSGTTGHGVMLASGKGLPRRFILVQLPELIDPADKDQVDAANFLSAQHLPLSIAELTKERLRRSRKHVVSEEGGANADTGFRVFKLESSNIRAWNPDPADLQRTVEEHTEHLRPDRTEQDVLYELLLKLGLDLAVPMESRQIAGKTVHSIGAGALLACLSDGIDRDVAEPLALGIAAWQKAQAQALQGGDDNAKPVSTKLVFKDSAFADDVAKTNLAAILSQHGLDDVRSI